MMLPIKANQMTGGKYAEEVNMNKSHLLWVDLTRIIAVFLVTLTHSALPVVYSFGNLPTANWMIGNIYNSLTRAAVPLFFMLSGFLLLQETETLREHLSKRIPRLLIPLVFWSLFYVFWNTHYEKTTTLSLFVVYQAFFTPACYHLWFLFALLGNYLFIPILRVLLNALSKTLRYYYLMLWFLAVSFFPIIEETTGIATTIDLAMVSGYVGYLVLGYMLGNFQITGRYVMYSMFVIIASLVTTVFGAYFLSASQGRLIRYFYYYLSPNVIILSLASFIFIKGIAERTAFLQHGVAETMLKALGSATFGIYLIHPVFLRLLQEGMFGFHLSGLNENPAYSILATAVMAFSLSFVATYALLKLPLIRRLVL